MATLSASFLAALLVSFVLISGCFGQWDSCNMEIQYPCAGKTNACAIECGSAVGFNVVTSSTCVRFGGTRGTAAYYCECVFRCPPKINRKTLHS